MHSLLLTRRLYFLSHTLIRNKFSISENNLTRNDMLQAQVLLYSDMLQYHEEHPDYEYRDIYHHFVDDDAQQILTNQHRRNLLLVFSICCIIAVIAGFVALEWIMSYLLKNVPISYIRV